MLFVAQKLRRFLTTEYAEGHGSDQGRGWPQKAQKAQKDEFRAVAFFCAYCAFVANHAWGQARFEVTVFSYLATSFSQSAPAGTSSRWQSSSQTAPHGSE